MTIKGLKVDAPTIALEGFIKSNNLDRTEVFEKNIAEQWESSGAFRVDANSKKPAFAISMPPPNATGQLHVGHAVMLFLEEIFTSCHRKDGQESLCLPWTDRRPLHYPILFNIVSVNPTRRLC